MKNVFYFFLFCTFSSSIWGQAPVDTIFASPNPFSKRTGINYSFSKNDTVSIYVVNTLGQNVITLFIDSIMPPGAYHDTLKMDAFPDGIYMVQLKLGHRKNKITKVIKTGTAGVAELDDNPFVGLYPNPVSSSLNIAVKPGISKWELTLFNSHGQLVCQFEGIAMAQKLDMTYLEPGIYHLCINYGAGRYSVKVIRD